MKRVRALALASVVGAIASLAGATPAYSQDDPDTEVPVPADDGYADTDPSALTDFRPALDGYGTWQDDPSYGTVWSPDEAQVGPSFEPYDTAGGWDYTDGSPVWVSDYEWGWVCFHYGRWAWSGGHWVWIPGREYAGAWVSWSMGDEAFAYVGWAPMAPSWIWWGGSPTAIGFGSAEPWLFTQGAQFVGPNVSTRAIPGSLAGAIPSHSRAYTRAQPRVGASPVPMGPPPVALGIDVTRVTMPPLPAREVRARQLARPSSAVALGAHAPTPHVLRTTPRPAGRAQMPVGTRATPSRGRR
jgi:hypothetical protein